MPPGKAEPPGGEGESSTGGSEIVKGDTEGFATYHVAGEVIHESVSFRQAPYPTPQDLGAYERIHPGFTDRILTLTERETEHRIQQERLETSATIDLGKRGQTYAFIVVITLVLGAIAAILTDHSVVGLAGLILAAATLVGAFVAPRLLSRGSDTTDEGVPGTEIERQSSPPGGPSEGPDA